MTVQTHNYDDKQPDVIDQASAIAMRHTDGLVEEARKRAVQKRQPDAAGNYADTICDDCGDDIPLERMRIAPRNDLCIHCLDQWERNARRGIFRKD